MPFIPVDDVALVEIVLLWHGQRCENTLYFKKTDSEWDSDSLRELGQAILTWWNTHLSPLTTTGAFITEIKVTSLNSDVAESVTVIPTGGQGNGANIAIGLPNNVCLCISIRTASRGKWARGRNYSIGMCQDQFTDNFAKTSYVTALVAAYNALLPLAESLGLTWVVVSRHLNKQPRLSGVTFDVTGALVADLALDSQRRRLTGRGQ